MSLWVIHELCLTQWWCDYTDFFCCFAPFSFFLMMSKNMFVGLWSWIVGFHGVLQALHDTIITNYFIYIKKRWKWRKKERWDGQQKYCFAGVKYLCTEQRCKLYHTPPFFCVLTFSFSLLYNNKHSCQPTWWFLIEVRLGWKKSTFFGGSTWSCDIFNPIITFVPFVRIFH